MCLFGGLSDCTYTGRAVPGNNLRVLSFESFGRRRMGERASFSLGERTYEIRALRVFNFHAFIVV